MLTALGTRRDTAPLESVLQATRSDDEAVQRVAIEAIGNVGDVTAVPRLLELLNDVELAGLAQTSLQRIRDRETDTRLVEVAQSAGKGTRIQLLDILNARRTVEAIPLFVDGISDDSPEVRQRCFGALSRLGQDSELTPILAGLAALTGSEKDRVERLVVNMCRRLPQGAAPVLAYFEGKGENEQQSLMPLLGRIGDARSLRTIRDSLRSKEMSKFAVAALCNWPSADVANDLRKIADTTKDRSERIRVLRALARVAVLGGSDDEKLERLRFVMSSASRPDERNLALDRAKAVRTVSSLQFVLPHISDSELGKRARRTVIDLAHHRGLREENRTEFEPALKKVIPLIEDERQLERAKKYLANE